MISLFVPYSLITKDFQIKIKHFIYTDQYLVAFGMVSEVYFSGGLCKADKWFIFIWKSLFVGNCSNISNTRVTTALVVTVTPSLPPSSLSSVSAHQQLIELHYDKMQLTLTPLWLLQYHHSISKLLYNLVFDYKLFLCELAWLKIESF